MLTQNNLKGLKVFVGVWPCTLITSLAPLLTLDFRQCNFATGENGVNLALQQGLENCQN